MWWDIAGLSCVGASLYVRFRWGDQRGGALIGMLASVCNLWATYRRRWVGRHTDSEGD